ncbi:MAG: hypothetical protein U9Q97_07295 [Acidobacteriota bacterium]|nr:hypothetical protein [Acidobacteriota bacterium]
MHKKSFDYGECDSGIFGKVKRPLISIDVKSYDGEWIHLRGILADTGADISILPCDIGKLLVEDITKGKTIELRGIVPYAKLIVFIHDLRFRLNGEEFITPTAIAESNDVVPILGRTKGLDLFEVLFGKGRKISFDDN